MANIVLFGEGDFSFTYAISKLMKTEEGVCTLSRYLGESFSPELHILATSLDTRQEVMEKYPAFVHMKFGDEVTIRHGVNALDFDDHKSEISSVVWNHPHLGREDALSHFQLLNHFFHKMEVLGVRSVFVSFLKGQVNRWKVLESANTHGYFLRCSGRLSEDDFPGFQCKRNLSGSSFKSSRTKDNWAADELTSVFLRFEKGLVANSPLEFDQSTETEISDQLSCHTCGKRFSSQQGLRTHIRQVHELQQYAKPSSVSCESCGKTFTSHSALEMHIKGAHGTLSVKRRRTDSHESSDFVCEICGSQDPFHVDLFSKNQSNQVMRCNFCEKEFKSLRALNQHTNIVHP